MDTFARREAERLLKELEIDSLPVSPLNIADKYKIFHKAMPSSEKGVSGMLIKINDNFGILYSTYHQNKGFENFSIAHELGHYFLPEHPEAIFSNGEVHESRAGYRSNDKYEKEADQFASGILMPDYLFKPALDKAGTGLGAIKSLSALCESSLTATAIRYAQRTPEPSAIIVSNEDKIDYCFMSDELKEYPNLTWLRKGARLPTDTETLAFNKADNNVTDNKEQESESDLNTWFQSDLDIEVVEEIIGLGSYGKTLTVLTIPDPLDLDELDEERELDDSWTPRFKK